MKLSSLTKDQSEGIIRLLNSSQGEKGIYLTLIGKSVKALQFVT